MQSPKAFVTGVMHPEAYHGEGKHRNFFEGWYVKLVSADLSQRWAVIPGIFKGRDQVADQSFVQILDGQTGRSWFHEFAAADFSAATNRFDVQIATNHFGSQGVSLDLPQLKGEIRFSELDPWPVTLSSPGIMGWYGLVPFMECFHGIVSFGHELSGSLEVEGRVVDFKGGRGYIEKDWGQAFPAGYVWLQSNHFVNQPDASFIGSVAIIPWLTGSFRGFIVGLKHSGKLHKWTTYNKTKERRLIIDDRHVRWTLDGPDGTLTVEAERVAGGLLHAPLRTAMHQRVEETMLATISLKHTDRNGRIVFESDGQCAAMEVFGDLERLLALG